MQDFELRVLKALAIGLEHSHTIAIAMGADILAVDDTLAALALRGLVFPIGIDDGHFKITDAGLELASYAVV